MLDVLLCRVRHGEGERGRKEGLVLSDSFR